MSNQAMQRLLATRAIQPKLTINSPNDEYEREADRVAEHVMRMPVPSAGAPPRIQRACAPCRRELESQRIQRLCSECEEELSRKKDDHTETEISPETGAQILALQTGGEPLPERARAYFESRFGRDLGGVRVHASAREAETASLVNARAYTLGKHIVFAHGEYSPDSVGGRRLIAHELVHTMQQEHAASSSDSVVQRLGDPTRVPAGLPCPVASDTPPNSVVEILFPNRGTVLTSTQKGFIQGFAVSWNALGASTNVRVDGYASPSGPDELNWRLSCERAQAVAAELLTPSASGVPPVPPGMLETFAQGETNEFSRTGGTDPDGPNRRAAISSMAPLPPPSPPPPPPLCPAVPTTTPTTCADRHTAYCDAQTCFPSNRWLPCVCTASGEVCEAVDAFTFTGATGNALAACAAIPPTAPSGPIVSKGTWFLSTNRCIWGHWRTALDAIHDPTFPIPSGITPEWSAAVTACRTFGIGSKECCEAHVVAEQSAIDRCGPYDSSVFGSLPTDVPGAPLCSAIVAAAAPPPAFTGDFGNVADRIAYGKSRCCP